MKLRLKKQLPFLHRQDLTEVTVEQVKSMQVVSSGTYRQSLKPREYAELLKNSSRIDKPEPKEAPPVEEGETISSFDEEGRRAELKKYGVRKLRDTAAPYADLGKDTSKEDMIEIIINAEKTANEPVE